MIGMIKVYVCQFATRKYHACYLNAAVTRLRKEVIFEGHIPISNSILQAAEYTKVMQMKPGVNIYISRKVQ